jgi:alkylation response protein AidB-like acyl-CoA dehydrogenase
VTVDPDQTTLLSRTLAEVLSAPTLDVHHQLVELGWDEVVAGDPAAATMLLFLEHGRALAITDLLDREVLAVLGVAADAVCYPARGDAPRSDGQQTVGLLLRPPAKGTTVAVPLTDGRVGLAPAASLTTTPLRTFDPSVTWHEVTGPPVTSPVQAPWDDALAAAHRALAAELIGTAGEVLRLAVEHTSTRTQFGAPIAAFQAVRHRLADAHVAIAAAQSLLEAAFVAGSGAAARAAKAQAGRAHELAAGHALQVCGAMGSSLEHPLHTFVSRGVVLDALLGGWAEQVSSLGREVLASGTTPLLIDV